jgi:hypothetical protein
MRTPGFTAEASLFKRGQLYFGFELNTVNYTDEVIYPAQSFFPWSGGLPIAWPPIPCPPGLVPILVKTGGEYVCTKMTNEFCVNRGTPWEKCYPARCIEWDISPIEYRWECQLPQFQLA